MPESSPTPLLSPRAALRLCAALLAGLAVVVLVALAERPRAVVLEDFSQTTAVGDARYFSIPNPPLAVPEPVLTWQGQPHAPASYETEPLRDTRMQRVALNEPSGLTIYEMREKPGVLFIKTGPNEYLRLAAR